MFGGDIFIVEDGEPGAVVVLADNPSPTARYAAEEFIHHVELATGIALPVVAESEFPDEPSARSARIVIGLTASARA